jgi:Na+-transporting NADH:ubiquinone oxidoreductase subunit NqrA
VCVCVCVRERSLVGLITHKFSHLVAQKQIALANMLIGGDSLCGTTASEPMIYIERMYL